MICLSVPLTPSPFLEKPHNQILLSFRLSCPSAAAAASVNDGLPCNSRQPFCNPISLSINNNERVLVPVSKRSVRGFCFKDSSQDDQDLSTLPEGMVVTSGPGGMSKDEIKVAPSQRSGFCFKDSSLSDQDDQDLSTLPEGMVVTSGPGGLSKDEIKVAPSQGAAVGGYTRYTQEELRGQRLWDYDYDSDSDSEFKDEDEDEDDYLMSDDMGSHCNWIVFYNVQLDFKTSTREEIVNMYLNRLTRAWGSEEEARRMILNVLLDNAFAVKVHRLRKCHSKILEDPTVDVYRGHEIFTSSAQLSLDTALLPRDAYEKLLNEKVLNKKKWDERRREIERERDILRREDEMRHEMRRKMIFQRFMGDSIPHIKEETKL